MILHSDGRRGGGAVVCLMLAAALAIAGCQHSSPPADTADNARSWLDEVVSNYEKASSYEDAGELHLVVQGEGGEQEESPAIPFSVAFKHPNKVHIHVLQANVVADGTTLRASVAPLEGQVLERPCPEKLTLENLFADPMLAEAARGQIGVVMPQLVLLFDANPLETFRGGPGGHARGCGN